MEVTFSVYILVKSSNIKFHEHPFSGSGAVPWGLTDRHEAKSLFSQFWERELSHYRIWRERERERERELL